MVRPALVALLFAFLLEAAPARADIRSIPHPDVLANAPQQLLTFFPPLLQPTISERDGVTFSYGGNPASLGFSCEPRPFGPMSCGIPYDDQVVQGFGASATPLEIRLPFATTRVGFETRFHVHAADSSTLVTVYSGATALGSVNTGTHSDSGRPSPWMWVGIESDEPFDRIVLTPPYITIYVDNLRFDTSARWALRSPADFAGGDAIFAVQAGPLTSANGVSFHHGKVTLQSFGVGEIWFNRLKADEDPDNQTLLVPIEIAFPRPISRLGLVLSGHAPLASRATFIVTFMRGTELVGSAPIGQGEPYLSFTPFWGIEGPKPFTKILITELPGSRIFFDEVRWTWAPP